jgi:endonuclease/exonuclease/phosphatase family metal-dependent hydrolase
MASSFRIATWNLERPRKWSLELARAIQKIDEIDADIIILTETSSLVQLDNYQCT